SARETDVVLLDTPVFDVDTDALLLDLERQHSRVPVLVVGGPPPGRMSGYPFAVRHLLKPIESERLRQEIDAVVREAAYERSLPPPPGRGGDESSDFLEWSQLALELAEETGESPVDAAAGTDAPGESPASRTAPGADAEAAGGRRADEETVEVPAPGSAAAAAPPEADDDAVEILDLAPADAGPPETGPARRDAGVPPPAPPRSKPLRPPPPRARGVNLERTLTVEGLDAAAPPLAGRTAAIVGRHIDLATRISLALYAAGVEVRILEGGLGDVLSGLRESPPDLLVVEPDGAEDVACTLREFRAEVRLWHRPLLLVAGDAEAEALLRTHVPGGPDAVVRADAGEAELVAKAGFLLAPAEQVRERMLRDKVATGEIGPVGVATLLRLAALARPEGRLVLRGEGRLAEFDLRGSEIVQARLTEPDGRSFEGPDALFLALTIRTGRYSLRPPPVARPLVSLRLPIPQALWDAADRLADLLRRLAPERLPRVRRLRLRDRAGPIRGLSPVELRARERLQTGDAPRVLAGAPGLDAERVALLVEKLALSGDVVDVEEDDGVVPAVSGFEDATIEVPARPEPPPVEASALFREPPAVLAEPGRPPAASPAAENAPVPEPAAVPETAAAAETAPVPETLVVSEVPPASSVPPPFGVLPAESAPADVAGSASPGAGSPVWPVAAGERSGAPWRGRAAWLVPIALLALGAGALAVLYATGWLGGARRGEPDRAPIAAL
ncbi:MAG: DUF4388 domain-containing protein, partial [Myxococcales bacterium]|nr:DUF4388 domain-containing protein [Myxococcales bacterium]